MDTLLGARPPSLTGAWSDIIGAPAVPGYEILGELGRGGMGVVYKARQKSLDRVVALKMVLGGGHALGTGLARLRAEAEVVARLQHPNIVQIHEIGEYEGLPFLCLEYLSGGTLAGRLAGTPMPPRGAAEMVAVLARAVHAAHSSGIIHRDLKPGNVLVGADGTPKVADFGLAKHGNSGLTASDAVLGTPSYMAPEQAEGRVRDVGPAADVYSLGAVLYECLTGRPPFRAATALETLQQVQSQEPVSVRALQPAVPRDLETICLKCLAKEPQRRYSSAETLAEDIERWLRGEPVVARPTGRLERGWRWCLRKPLLAAAFLVAAAGLLSTVVVSVWFGLSERRNAVTLGQAKERAEEKERQARLRLAETHLDRGVVLCEQGEVGRGLLWLARGLEELPEKGGADIERVLRANLAAWRFELAGLQAVFAQDGPVERVAFSPDGRRFMAWEQPRRARLWETATGRRLGEPFDQLNFAVEWGPPCTFSPDGRRLLTVHRDDKGRQEMSARLWNSEGQPLGGPLKPKAFKFDAVGFHSDGRPLLVTTSDARGRHDALVWDGTTGELLVPPLRERDRLGLIALEPGCRVLLTTTHEQSRPRRWTSTDDGRVGQLWDLTTGKAVGGRMVHESRVTAAVFSSDAKLLVTGCLDGKVRRWRVPEGTLVGPPLQAGSAERVGFSGDSELFYCSGGTKTLFWHTASGEPAGFPSEGTLHALAPNGRALVLRKNSAQGGSGTELRLHDRATGRPLGQPFAHDRGVRAAAFPPDGQAVLTGGTDRALRLWKLPRGSVPRAVIPPVVPSNDDFFHARILPDGRLLLGSTMYGDSLHRFDLEGRGQPLKHQEAGPVFAVSPDGRLAVRSGRPGLALPLRGSGNAALADAWLCDLDTGQPVGNRLDLGGRLLKEAVFRPDGRAVLTACVGHTSGDEVRLWDASTGTPLGPPLPEKGQSPVLAFCPDGRFGAAGDRFRLWLLDGGTGVPLGESLPCAIPRQVVFAADGRTLVAAGENDIQVWDVATRERVGPALRAGGKISPDGRLVLAMERVWEVPTPARPSWKARGEQQLQDGVLDKFSADGSAFFTTREHVIRAWDTATGKPLGPSRTHPGQGRAFYLDVGSDGQTLVTSFGDIRVWQLPQRLEGSPERVALWVQVITGLELDVDTNVVRVLDAYAWQERRRRLDELGGPPGR